MEMTTPWFIDAWAVYDGLAFTSRSTPDVRRTERVTDADTTVFLSVPELEPIPLGRITTGLRAARSSFQDGFFDEDGSEIAFESLESVRETVRRGYLASGLGPGGAGMPERPAPAPAAPAAPATVTDGELEPEPPLDLARRLLEEDPAALRDAIRQYAQAVVIDWENGFNGSEPALPGTQAALAEFYLELTDAGIWETPYRQAEFVQEHNLIVGSRTFDPHSGFALRRRYPPERLLATAPCPNLLSPPTFSRLSDPVKLSMCDSTYLRTGGLPRATQVLIAAILVGVAGEDPAMFWFGADGVLDHRLRGALDWIEAQLPTGIVPEPADRLLNVFARRWLEGPPTFPPPSPAAAPPVAPTVRGAAT